MMLQFGVVSAMSLRDAGGEEECFECDCQEEEREPACEQYDTLDFMEEGNCCGLPEPFTPPSRVTCLPPRSCCSDFVTRELLIWVSRLHGGFASGICGLPEVFGL